jgi:putative spermidine/putrescine transport system ATP-binding protein
MRSVDTTPLVRFGGVEKTYDGVALVVREMNLDIRRGEFLTLLGPSGSGKTTTLMMLAGFEVPTRGTIAIEGRDISRVPAYKRGIGVVFQNYALFPHLTVAENLVFPLRVRRVARAERDERVRRALDIVRLDDLGERMPAQLSGGQQQRVALARALIFEPSLVLMDEPLGSLDKQLRERMQYEIKSLHERLGVTFVYVTHDQAEALTMSERIAVFNDGRIEQVAPPRQIYEHPDTAFVAQFIGENNRLLGAVAAVSGGQAEVTLDSGGRVVCEAAGGIAAGERVLVSLRPERVAILEAAAGMPNRFEAVLRDVIYHGDHVRLRLEALGQTDFIVTAPVRELDRGGIGMTVAIGWGVRDGRALALAP